MNKPAGQPSAPLRPGELGTLANALRRALPGNRRHRPNSRASPGSCTGSTPRPLGSSSPAARPDAFRRSERRPRRRHARKALPRDLPPTPSSPTRARSSSALAPDPRRRGRVQVVGLRGDGLRARARSRTTACVERRGVARARRASGESRLSPPDPRAPRRARRAARRRRALRRAALARAPEAPRPARELRRVGGRRNSRPVSRSKPTCPPTCASSSDADCATSRAQPLDERERERERRELRLQNGDALVRATPARPDELARQQALGRRALAGAHDHERRRHEATDAPLRLDARLERDEPGSGIARLHEQPELIRLASVVGHPRPGHAP